MMGFMFAFPGRPAQVGPAHSRQSTIIANTPISAYTKTGGAMSKTARWGILPRTGRSHGKSIRNASGNHRLAKGRLRDPRVAGHRRHGASIQGAEHFLGPHRGHEGAAAKHSGPEN